MIDQVMLFVQGVHLDANLIHRRADKSVDRVLPQVQGALVFHGSESAQGDLNPILVVPANVGVDRLNELLNSGAFPVQRMEPLGLDPNQ